MSPLYFTLQQSLAVVMGLIALGIIMRQRSIISADHNKLFGKLVTDFALPAMVFISLAQDKLERDQILGSVTMVTSMILCIIAAWIIGKALKLEPKTLGGFVLVASVGSSSTLGYTIIGQVFPGHAAISDAVVFSELGVVLPLFAIAVPVAIYLSQAKGQVGQAKGNSMASAFKEYLLSPLFWSMVLGLAISALHLPLGGPIPDILFKILTVASGSLAIFVSMSIALMLRPLPVRSLALLIVGASIVTLVFKPLSVLALADISHLPPLDNEILFIEAAMPSGTIAAVMAGRYGCDGATASALVVATYGLCLLTIPLLMLLLS